MTKNQDMIKNKLLILIPVIIGIILLLITILIIVYHPKKNCKKNDVQIKYKEILEKDLRKQDNIVFLGDSITDYYPIDSIFTDLPIVKSGVSGYTTDDILKRMDSMVYQYNPTKVFILIGTNDINSEDDKKEDTINKIKEIVEKIKKKRKKAKIYLESIYPVNKNKSKEMVKYRDNDTIREIGRAHV